jgi:hypothetical protein
MKTRVLCFVLAFLSIGLFQSVAQETDTSAAVPAATTHASVPNLIRFSGVAEDVDSKPLAGTVGITFLFYRDQQGGAPLWMETQNVRADASGRYSVELGATKSNGLPTEVFTSGEARWIGVQVSGQAEQPRVLVMSVPYALKAADAETIGGLPPSAFVKATPAVGSSPVPAGSQNGTGSSSATAGSPTNKFGSAPTPQFTVTTPGGVVGQLPLWTTQTAIRSSVINQVGAGAAATVGIGSSSPGERLTVGGNSLADTKIEVNAGGDQYAASRIRNSQVSWLWQVVPSRDSPGGRLRLVDETATKEWLAITHTGNVGVGTNTPGAKLDVLGNDNSPLASGVQVSAPTFPQYLFNATNGASDAKIWRMIGRGTNDFEIQTLNDSYGGEVTAMRIKRIGTSIKTVTFPGLVNVGIGTDTPTKTLFVVGDVAITGNLTKGSGSFKIDHPLDPANKYLYHSFVESPDMMNIYNGVVVLDSKGEASVDLPEYFQALNSDFRYQLTAIGVPGPKLYIAEEISGNHFKVAGGKSGAKVSWQVTGVRQDAYAKAHRIKVEEDKPAQEKGHYLHPELFGATEKEATGANSRPAMTLPVIAAETNVGNLR